MNVLEALGEPVDTLVTLDLETYYDREYSLSKLTTESYVRDPRFAVICAAVKVGNSPAVCVEEPVFRAWTKRVDWSRVAVLAHNTAFDGFVLSQEYGVVPRFLADTLSMGRLLHGLEVGGSLKKMAAHYAVGEKGNEVLNALGKHRPDFTPEEFAAYQEYCRNDTELCRAIFDRMTDAGFLETELWLIDSTIRAFVDPTFVLNSPLLEDYLVYEKQRKADLLNRISADRSVLMSNDKFAALLLEMGVAPPRKVSPRTKKETWAFSKVDAGMKALLEHENEDVRLLAEARVGVKSTINQTRTERFLRMGANGRRLPVFLKYHGSHTGRWSAGDRTNFQNLERTSKKNPRKGVLRKALLAPEGHVVVVADSAQIEARKLAWFAGHNSLVMAFAQNRDVYSEFASEVYARPVDRKANPVEDEIPGFVGKTSVLGLGYGMGFLKFALTLLAGAMGGPPVQFTDREASALDIDVGRFKSDPKKVKRLQGVPTRLSVDEMITHCAVAEYVVNTWRSINEPIVNTWRQMDSILQAMCFGIELNFGPNQAWRTVQNGIVMPTGRVLRYPGLEVGEDGFTYLGGRGGKERTKIYGGALVENIIQGGARDVIGEQLLWVRASGRHVVTCTHDEIVALAPEAEGREALDSMLRIMKTPPAWAAGLPLSAEGGYGRSYGDAK